MAGASAGASASAPAAAAAAYGARAAEYIAAVGRMEHTLPADRELLEEWAAGLSGPVLDVGSGPGQWTHHLADRGSDISGLEPAPAFVAAARDAYPDQRFRVGRAESLGVADGSLGGILAWYSLIHTSPDLIAAALEEFARAIRPGGGLAIGYFAGERLEPFAHAVHEAFAWPPALLRARIESAGFSVLHAAERQDRPDRLHGEIIAVRR